MTAPTRPASIASELGDRIRAVITERGLQPGTRLPPERELSEILKVSRPTVREALGRLSQDGVIIARRGSGTYVAPLDLRHVFEVRLQLEPFGAALAAKARTATDLEQLAELVDRLGEALEDSDRFVAADVAFHSTVAQATKNPVLIDVLDRLVGLGRISRDLTAHDRRIRAETLRQLRRVSAAIHKHDEATAASAMRVHLEHVLLVSRIGER